MRLIDASKFDLKGAEITWIEQRDYAITAHIEKIYKIPTVDAAPVKHGRWVGKRYNFKTNEMETVPYDPKSFDDIEELTCSVCGKHSLLNEYEEEIPSNYCPSCGAKMDLEG